MTDFPIVTPSVLDATNFKEFFLKYDGLNHVCQELAFSIFKRYLCKAGCKMCYLQNDWIADEEFGVYVPREITPQVEERLLSFFSAFHAVGTYDDLSLLKKKYPHLYQFYVRNSNAMINTSMTDTAFIQQHPLLMNELHFAGVYEITFSDLFLAKKQGKFVYDIVDMLKDLHQRSPLTKLKIIQCLPCGETSDVLRVITDFAHGIEIPVGLHDDIIAGANNQLSTEVADYQERNYYAEASEPMQVLSEITYFQHTGAFMTLTDTVSPDAQPFYDLMTDGVDDLSKFLWATLEAKKATYRRYIRTITHREHNKMLDYFTFVDTCVHINRNYNFIPKMLLQPWVTMYTALKQQGWIETPYGLIRPRADNTVTPILTITDTPRQTLASIPVVEVTQ